MKNSIPQTLALIACLISPSAFSASCQQGDKTHIWISPRIITAGAPVNVMAVSTSQAPTQFVLTLPNGEKQTLTASANEGLPWRLSTKIDKVEAGLYQLEVKDKDNVLACREIFTGDNGVEKSTAWNESYEAFYAAWIEQLFDSPAEQRLSFPSLQPVLQNPVRNFLHNSLGLNEDKGFSATPDCADFPYYLRSYFAWKNGLPFSFRVCNRGSTNKLPVCEAASIRTDFVQKIAPLATFKSLVNTVMNTAHSGSSRTAYADEASDFYPVALKREVLWPGTIYSDPYGHVLMLAKWQPQTATSPGILFAMDAQPDNSVSRKRFWEGTFLFDHLASADPGFKTFRPIASDGSILSNAQLPNYSTEQAALSPDDFYAKLYKLINPDGLNAKQAYEALLAGLVEQLQTRVQSVELGENYFRKGGRTIDMPESAAIFETAGAWEDYATPSRDMRLLMAMNVLQSFPEKIIRYPELFKLTAESAPEMKAQIEQLHQKLTAENKIHYIRSDGKFWALSVAQILARKTGFEIAYNPNDCVEVRWGSSEGMEDYATCKVRAPAEQLKKMEAVRSWFHNTKRPLR